ncbi:hypothetical protein Q3W71_17890 [Micromonospora sp. C28SCA-DRY-2]|uniref:hypothetical protein n=1 Tax=Micromonospora sp. C28SCA-DRY-2 TaxID=3059522 RepID=UPI002676E7CA|nr:hypothetical protein [Micromonospora sp. C28SCA-DRY-2]MDO3703545.1 hypothetical protein [Micromonospora sp. C28SCA-DRY-2]
MAFFTGVAFPAAGVVVSAGVTVCRAGGVAVWAVGVVVVSATAAGVSAGVAVC